eukprot:3828551-Rhodomonas_salina.2
MREDERGRERMREDEGGRAGGRKGKRGQGRRRQVRTPSSVPLALPPPLAHANPNGTQPCGMEKSERGQEG